MNTEYEMATIAQVVRENTAPEVHEIIPDKAQFAVVPKGMELQSLKKFEDERRLVPIRRDGSVTTHDLDSFHAHVARFVSPDTVIFAKQPKVESNDVSFSMTAVIDHHPSGTDIEKAGAEKHKITYTAAQHVRIKKWLGGSNKWLNVADFSSFIEDNISDLVGAESAAGFTIPFGKAVAAPAEMLTLSRGLEVFQSSRVANSTRLSSGETQVVFEVENRTKDGSQVNVPEWFFIRVPVFVGGEHIVIPMRLRYRVREGAIVFSFLTFEFEQLLDGLVSQTIDKTREVLSTTHVVEGVQ